LIGRTAIGRTPNDALAIRPLEQANYKTHALFLGRYITAGETMNRSLCLLATLATILLSGCGGSTSPPEGANGVPKAIRPRFSLDTGTERGFTALAVSPDGRIAIGQATGSKQNVQVWDLEKKVRLHAHDSESGSVLPVAISPDGKTAAYARQSPLCIPLIDVASGKELRRLNKKNGGLGFMQGLNFSTTGDLIVVASGRDLLGPR